jgi:hypothetical protein
LALCSLEKNKLFLFLDARARSAILKGQRYADTGAAEACRPTTLSGGSLKTEERTQLRARGRRAGELNLHCSTSRGRIASAPTGSASPDSGLAAGGEEVLLRKEVIQPHLPVRLPCYDFTPITDPTFDGSLLAVGPPASGVADFRGVTGGVYKARERIHPGNADPGLLATPASRSRVADFDPN